MVNNSIMKNESTDYLENDDNSSHPDTIVIIKCVLNAPLMLIAITGNALVLAAVLRTASLRSQSTVFLCGLAVSDLLVGLVVQPLYIVRQLKHSRSLQHAYTILSALVCGVSLFTMATISFDRSLALHYHLRYANLMTTKRAIYVSVTLWFMCALLSCTYFLSKEVYLLVIAGSIGICLSISTFAYVRIYRIVRHHQLQIQVQQQAVESLNTEHNLNLARSKKSAVNTFIYYMCMILCYSPEFISSLVFVLFNNNLETVWTLTDTVIFLNSSINPFLYCWRLSGLRVAVVKTIRKMLCKQTEEM